MSNTPLPEPDYRLPMDGPPRYRADQMHAHAAAVSAAKDARIKVLEDALRGCLSQLECHENDTVNGEPQCMLDARAALGDKTP